MYAFRADPFALRFLRFCTDFETNMFCVFMSRKYENQVGVGVCFFGSMGSGGTSYRCLWQVWGGIIE